MGSCLSGALFIRDVLPSRILRVVRDLLSQTVPKSYWLGDAGEAWCPPWQPPAALLKLLRASAEDTAVPHCCRGHGSWHTLLSGEAQCGDSLLGFSRSFLPLVSPWIQRSP